MTEIFLLFYVYFFHRDMNFKIISPVPCYLWPWYHYAGSFSRWINYAHSPASQFIRGNGRSVEDQSQVRIPAVTRFNYGEFHVNGLHRIILDQAISTINFNTIHIFICVLCVIYICSFSYQLLFNICICKILKYIIKLYIVYIIKIIIVYCIYYKTVNIKIYVKNLLYTCIICIYVYICVIARVHASLREIHNLLNLFILLHFHN